MAGVRVTQNPNGLALHQRTEEYVSVAGSADAGTDEVAGTNGGNLDAALIVGGEAGGTAIGIDGGARLLADQETALTKTRFRSQALAEFPPDGFDYSNSGERELDDDEDFECPF